MIEVRDSRVQGKGIFATKYIKKGERIIEYIGERITHDEADKRYDDAAMERHHTFLMAVDENVVIDGAVEGNESIYINHSCEPNCEPDVQEGRVYIVAICDIKKGEELFYDYAYERDAEDEDPHYPCHCGSASCRGTILAPQEESE